MNKKEYTEFINKECPSRFKEEYSLNWNSQTDEIKKNYFNKLFKENITMIDVSCTDCYYLRTFDRFCLHQLCVHFGENIKRDYLDCDWFE